jgi:thiol-disulfide isomerase/thioredoxin
MNRLKTRKIFTIAIFIVIGFFIFSATGRSWLLRGMLSLGVFNKEIKKPDNNASTTVAFSFQNAAGESTSTATYKGKIVFINFWASWCPPCQAEMPSINDLYNKLRRDTGFVFLSINEDEDSTKAIAYVQNNHFSFPFFIANDVPEDVFGGSLPTTVIVDRTGKIIFKHDGMANYDTDKFLQQLRAL